MTQDDRAKFHAELNTLFGLYGRDKPSRDIVRAWWTVLEGYDLEDILQAFLAHFGSERHAPTPSCIIAKMPAAWSRPSGDEAWGICLRSMSEDDSLMLNDEIMQARAAAFPILEIGDEVGARMAFRAAYQRITADPQRRPEWFISLGHDAARRQDVVEEAVACGLLSSDAALLLLPQIVDEQDKPGEPLLRLCGTVADEPVPVAEILQDLRDKLSGTRKRQGDQGRADREAHKAAELERLEELRKER